VNCDLWVAFLIPYSIAVTVGILMIPVIVWLGGRR